MEAQKTFIRTEPFEYIFGMKFVALVSGGKDSCYSILHSIRQGHELVALANLHPVDESQQELDSFMFQTVGHDIISSYEECTGLPLFRKSISPLGSKNVSLNYSRTEDDEIEDLYQLLNEVKKKIPDIEAVNAGAILSSYQRTRVEDVCSRLGLTSLSYLWQRNQYELMSEMCSMSKTASDTNEPKMDARIIKVAAIGLDNRHLGKSLPEIFPTLQRLNQMYDVHICGEGGEFESMVLDSPFFVNGFLKIAEQDDLPSEGSGGVYSTRFKVEFIKRSIEAPISTLLEELPIPPLLNTEWANLYEEILKVNDGQDMVTKKIDVTEALHKPKMSIDKIGEKIHIVNLRPRCGGSLEDKCRDVFDNLRNALSKRSLLPSQVLSSSLLLHDMSNFGEINKIYNDFFDVMKIGPLPPSRSCIESNLVGEDCPLQLSVIVDASEQLSDSCKPFSNESKSGLHVQGRSYWAPCNIGPYSQAIWSNKDDNKICYISGQIALIPEKMCMPEDSDDFHVAATLQSVLSLRHFHTIKTTINAKYQLSMVCYVSQNSMVPIVAQTWFKYCKQLCAGSKWQARNDQDGTGCLIIVKVSALPREALCEWGGIACNTTFSRPEDSEDFEDDEDIGKGKDNISHPNTLLDNKVAFRSIVSRFKDSRIFVTLFLDSSGELSTVLKRYHSHHIILFYSTDCKDICEDFVSIEYCPVEAVYDHSGKKRLLGLQISS